MGRAPCCEKMGLKRGPWTPAEDRILIDHINTYGHANWRALPKQAGLLRCGKSCRLRWINYLRPDIKRGNLTREEEDAIINLHEMLGNRWSAIAARLPGRTDNEIKNVWHTHLKKRLPQNKQGAHNSNNPKRNNKKQTKLDIVVDASKSNQDDKQEDDDDGSQSHQQCSSDMSSLSTSSDNNHEHHNNNSNSSSSSSSIATTTNNNNHDMSINNDNDDGGGDSAENNLALDEDFWMEVLSCDNNSSESTTTTSGVLDSNISDGADYRVQVPFSPVLGSEEGVLSGSSLSMCDEMDFWYDVYSRAEDISELLEL